MAKSNRSFLQAERYVAGSIYIGLGVNGRSGWPQASVGTIQKVAHKNRIHYPDFSGR